MTHATVFSGIGGPEIAAEWMGWKNIFHCEINPFGRRVLSYYWPNAKSYDDITKTDFNVWRGQIDVLTGGFPCQPYSTAGKRLGKEDDRHLWPEMLRAIREIQPRFVVGENVYGIVSWNEGLVFEEVQTDLENEGYEVQPVILPAAGVNAPHRRDRVWFVAHRTNSRDESVQGRAECADLPGDASDTTSIRQPRQGRAERQKCAESIKEWKASWSYDDGRWPTQPPIRSRDDGIPSELDGITFSNWRQESIKAYGNAIVPQVIYQIYKALTQTPDQPHHPAPTNDEALQDNSQ